MPLCFDDRNDARPLVHVATIERSAPWLTPTSGLEVWQWFLDVVNACGVCVLATCKHDFPGGGVTGVVVLGESHAAIHTWPERSTLWAELATCGDVQQCETFERLLATTSPGQRVRGL